MHYNDLKRKVCKANKDLVKHGLVLFTWGNLSAYDPEKNVVAIKPSGVSYDVLSPEDIPILTLEGTKIEGKLNPSSDTETHLEIYRNFKNILSIVHTHSTYATIFSQAKKTIPCLGTTHADYFYGDIPLVSELQETEVRKDYEKNTGHKIVEYYKENNLSPLHNVACLCPGHGPFVWGKSIEKAVYHAAVLEQVAKMAFQTLKLNPSIEVISNYLLDKHYLRKHGASSYYGQKEIFNEDNYSSR